VITLGLAGVVFLLFLVEVAREPRAFGNAVLLGLALALGGLGLAERLADTPGRAAHLLLLALVLAPALVPFVIGCYLLVNGITMIRRESLRPGNLLSLLAGTAVFVVIGLDVAAGRAEDVELSLFATVATLVFGYVSFLLVSYVCYALVYGLVARTGGSGFVIVLGAGLGPGGQVPPLLASRLDRGFSIWTSLNRRASGPGPLLIVSGGKGDDEQVAEAAAMASYLTARGFPADHLLLEDRSRSTEENLLFSKAIMEQVRRGARCTIVTSDFHAFRAAMIARRLGIRGQVTGARVAGYYRPSAMLREFAAVLLGYWAVNLAICAVLVCVPVGYAVLRHVLPVLHG
jgi:uncharacterized SAM-binding protein YcdF (DUF218 family)